VACPAITIDRGPCAKRPVVPLSILYTHWINELRLDAVKACSLAIQRRLHSARRQTAMQSHGYLELVAELPQWLKKQGGITANQGGIIANVGAAAGQRGRQGPSASLVSKPVLKSTAQNLSLTSRRPVKKEDVTLVRGSTLARCSSRVFRFSNALGNWARINTKNRRGMDHESEIFPAKRSRSGYWIDVFIAASRRRVLDDLPSWINNNSERSGDSRCSRDGGTNRLTGTNNRQKSRSDRQSLTYSSAGKAEGNSE
jgi:hypothetical protein